MKSQSGPIQLDNQAGNNESIIDKINYINKEIMKFIKIIMKYNEAEGGI